MLCSDEALCLPIASSGSNDAAAGASSVFMTTGSARPTVQNVARGKAHTAGAWWRGRSVGADSPRTAESATADSISRILPCELKAKRQGKHTSDYILLCVPS